MKRWDRLHGSRLGSWLIVILFLAFVALQSGVAAEAPTDQFPFNIDVGQPFLTAQPAMRIGVEGHLPAAEPATNVGVFFEARADTFINYQVGMITSCGVEQTIPGPGAVRFSTAVGDHVEVFSEQQDWVAGPVVLSSVATVDIPPARNVDVRALPPSVPASCQGPTSGEYLVVWSQVHNVTLPAKGTVNVVAEAPVLHDPTDKPEVVRYIVRAWDPDANQGVLVGTGDSYRPHDGATADWNVVAVTQRNLSLVLAGIAAAGLTTAHAWKSHRWKDWSLPLPWPFLWLFTRLRTSKLLEHETRRMLYDLIEANPGIRFVQLRRRSALATGVVTHHLRMLEEHGLVVSILKGRQRHLYRKGALPVPADATLPDLQRRLLEAWRQGVSRQAELARRLEVSQQVVSYHLRKLREQGRLEAGAKEETVGRGPRPTFDPRVLLDRPNVRDMPSMG